MSEIELVVPKRRKLTMQDVKAVAELVAKRLTETEACLQLEINPQQWFQFKNRSKRSEKFESTVSRVKGAKIQACMETLEEAGKAVNAKTGIPEWRAADRFLERIDDRFVMRSDVNVNVLTVNGAPNEIVDAAREAFLRQAKGVNCGVTQPEKPAQIVSKTPQDAQVIDVRGQNS